MEGNSCCGGPGGPLHSPGCLWALPLTATQIALEEQAEAHAKRTKGLLKRCLEFLKTVEWGTEDVCPSCGAMGFAGHAPDCDLVALLMELSR